MEIIAHIYNDFPTKFALPRQSGVVKTLESRIVFTPKYRDEHALRGLESFSHIWVIWEISGNKRGEWSPTVRPPRLGGNVRMGVFATRSPFRPNPIGLSCVRLERIERTEEGSVLVVTGGDMMNGTPIYDIKPYIPYADSIPDAKEGFTASGIGRLAVEIPDELLALVPEDRRETLLGVLSLDPRPAYHDDPERVYGFKYAGFNIRFQVRRETVTVTEIVPSDTQD